ncbi:hypothetical protein GCM10009601_17180 [Streptomyces thermospinosisporus]|uniref:DUF8175 domain-containing protein n=1 Tax=Streptomyces thermospinosisporus TaxID=161482 RepID=A0ABP4JGX9_9ACTN
MSLGDGESGQTRTRMPEGGGDLYGGARRGGRRSSSRSLVTVVGVVVLLIAAIAFANRGGEDSGTGEESADSPKSAATAPTGEKPVSTKAAGIPSGFAHTRQGAESAAANYAVVLGSAEMFDKARRDAILRAVIVPGRVAAFEAQLDKAYSPKFNKSLGLDENGSAPKGFTFVSRTTPVGTKVTAWTADSATVEVWCSGLLGLAGEKSTNPVTSSWFTITMQLEWTDGDWKIVTHSQKVGPAPIPGDERAAGADEMAKAVKEYGGFTYAR